MPRLRYAVRSRRMWRSRADDRLVKRGEAAPTDTPEILVGSTNRLESPTEGELRMNDFVIRFQNNRLVICGGSDSATLRAAEFFIENFIDYDGGRLSYRTAASFSTARRSSVKAIF